MRSLSTTNRRSGDLIIHLFADSSSESHANRKEIITQAARSMPARHYWKERNAFNNWLLGPKKRPAIFIAGKGITLRGPVGSTLRLRRLINKDGLRTDYTDELANAMANAVFDKPSMRPDSRMAPSRQAVFYASALFKRQPTVAVASFNDLSDVELQRQRMSHIKPRLSQSTGAF